MTNNVNIFTLSERVNDRARRLGLSLTALSEKAGLAKSTITGMLQSPERTPRPSTLNKIARALDVDPRYLVGGIDEPGRWQDYYSINSNELSESGREFGVAAAEKFIELKIGRVNAGFGVSASASVAVAPIERVETGCLYLVEIPKHGRKICYFAEPYFMWMDEDGQIKHLTSGSEGEILGRIATPKKHD